MFTGCSETGYRFLSDEGPMLETLEYTIRIGSTPTFLYFDLTPYYIDLSTMAGCIIYSQCSCLFTNASVPRFEKTL